VAELLEKYAEDKYCSMIMARFDPIGASHYHRLHGQDISRPRIWARFPTAGPARHRWGRSAHSAAKVGYLGCRRLPRGPSLLSP